MRILLTNDDGISAAGLILVERLLRDLGHDVWVVAPREEQSGRSRAITLHHDLAVAPCGANRWSLSGTPVDCLLYALSNLYGDTPPDLVVSGLNLGGNMAEDVAYSGTCGAALEASACGVPALALSQTRAPDVNDLDLAKDILGANLAKLLTLTGAQMGVLNVNLPNRRISDPVACHLVPLGQRAAGTPLIKTGESDQGQLFTYPRRQPEGDARLSTDLAVVQAGHVAITPLQPHYGDLDRLKALQLAHGAIL